MSGKHRVLFVLLSMSWLVVASGGIAADAPALKTVFAGKFKVGAALGTHQVMGAEPTALDLVARQFNTITSENLLKWQEIHPRPDQYDFEPADRYVKFGEEHKMFILGLNLV